MHAHEARQMEVVKNIEAKVEAIRDAEAAMLTLNKHLDKEHFSKETLAMLSELKVDLFEIRDVQVNSEFVNFLDNI